MNILQFIYLFLFTCSNCWRLLNVGFKLYSQQGWQIYWQIFTCFYSGCMSLMVLSLLCTKRGLNIISIWQQWNKRVFNLEGLPAISFIYSAPQSHYFNLTKETEITSATATSVWVLRWQRVCIITLLLLKCLSVSCSHIWYLSAGFNYSLLRSSKLHCTLLWLRKLTGITPDRHNLCHLYSGKLVSFYTTYCYWVTSVALCRSHHSSLDSLEGMARTVAEGTMSEQTNKFLQFSEQ